MPAALAIAVGGLDATLAQLGEAAGRLEHPAPLFDLIGAAMVTSTQMRFEAGIDPEGHPWPISLRVQFEGGKTLIDSGLLRNSLTHEASDAGVAWGTNVIYAGVHQRGAVIRPVNAEALHFRLGGEDVFTREVTIPRRAFLGVDQDDEAEILDIAAEYVMAPLGGADAAR